MTLLGWFQPFMVCLMLSGLLPLIHRRLHPRVSAAVLAASVVWISAVAVVGIWLVAFRYLAHISWLAAQFQWCSVIVGAHSTVSSWVGVPAVAAMITGVVRAVRFWRVQRELRSSRLRGTSIVTSDDVFAFVVPGPNAATIVSSGLLRHLGSEEQAVVFAHERAHADHRHDRYLTIGRAAEAVLPIIRPLTRRLEFSLERWADDAAVSAVNGDRLLVARTIAKVALLPHRALRPVLGFTGLGEAARAEFLLDPPRRSRALTGLAILSSAVGLTFALYQLHHFEALFNTLCRT